MTDFQPPVVPPDDLEWAAQFTDDEWDSVVASAVTGDPDDFSFMDDDDD